MLLRRTIDFRAPWARFRFAALSRERFSKQNEMKSLPDLSSSLKVQIAKKFSLVAHSWNLECCLKRGIYVYIIGNGKKTTIKFSPRKSKFCLLQRKEGIFFVFKCITSYTTIEFKDLFKHRNSAHESKKNGAGYCITLTARPETNITRNSIRYRGTITVDENSISQARNRGPKT